MITSYIKQFAVSQINSYRFLVDAALRPEQVQVDMLDAMGRIFIFKDLNRHAGSIGALLLQTIKTAANTGLVRSVADGKVVYTWVYPMVKESEGDSLAYTFMNEAVYELAFKAAKLYPKFTSLMGRDYREWAHEKAEALERFENEHEAPHEMAYH